MKKISLLLLLALSAGTLAAAPIFRADIQGLRKEGKVKLAPAVVEGDNIKTINVNWGKEEDRPYYVFGQGSRLAPDQWTVQIFSFKAEEDGKITIEFGGQWAKEAKDREWVLIADIKINGEALPNADFSKTYKNQDRQIPNGFWMHNKATLVPGAGPEGKGAVRANHDNRLYYAPVVEAGKTYTVSLQVKPAPAE